MGLRILESKRELRCKLAGLPIVEKLGMLDAMRVRDREIRGKLARQKHGKKKDVCG